MNLSHSQTCTADAPTATRICRRCLQSLPVDRFSLRSTVSQKRQTWCIECHAQYNREYRLRHSKKREERQLHSAWSKIASAKQRRTCVQTVIVRLVLAFGGPERLAEKWVQAFENASPARQVRCCESLCWLIEKFQQNPECLDVQRIQDIESEQQRLAKQIVREQLLTNADSVAEIASEMGYRLSPATV